MDAFVELANHAPAALREYPRIRKLDLNIIRSEDAVPIIIYVQGCSHE